MAIRDTSRQAMADVDLVLRTRSGDAEAFGELWRRHHASGVAVARSVTSSIEPGELVQEAYSRIHQAILKGGGPNGSFRAYLFASIRNTAAAWAARARDSAADELETVSTAGSPDEALDRGLIAQAFRSLPPRWQEVLWYSEVERLEPSEIAPLLGMSAAGVSQLSLRARDGLREAWFQAHLRSAGQRSDCQRTIENLDAHASGDLSAHAQRRVDDHLESCARCAIVAAEAHDVADHLPLVLLPLVLGVDGVGAYLGSIRSGSAPSGSVPSATVPSGSVPSGSVPSPGPDAMPPSVVSGVVVASDHTALRGGPSPAAPVGSTRSVLGIGAVVGAGSVALLVAGVVAAAAVAPTLISGAPSMSRPSAADPAASSIASEVEPDATMDADEPMIIRVDEERPRPVPRTPSRPVPHAPKAPRAAVPAPVAVPEPVKPTPPSASPSPQPEPGATPTPSPEPPSDPTPTPTPDPTPTPGDGTATGDGSATGDETRPGGGTAPDEETVRGDEPVVPRGEMAAIDENPFPETAE